MRHPDSSLAAYVEGTATARERATAEVHLASCAACRKEVTRARRARRALTSLPEVEAPGIDVSVVVQVARASRSARAPSPATTAARAATAPPVTAGRPARPLPDGEVAPPAPFEEAPARTQETPAAGTRPRPAPASDETQRRDVTPHVGDAAAPLGAEPAPVIELPAEGERIRKRRERDRAWQLRVVQGALGAAAVLVAIVLFVGLRNPPAPTTARDQTSEAGGQPQAPATFESARAFDAGTFQAYARELAEEVRANDAVRQARDEQALAATPKAGQDATAEESAIACINRDTKLVGRTHLYSLIQGTFDGRPVHVGAFLSKVGSDNPVLLVIAAAVDGCDLVQLVQEPV
jgi:hypothetical protein